MNLNKETWGEFKIGDLFPVLQNGKANQGMLSEGSDCFYIGAKKDDNGVMIHCAYDADLIQKGNCIIFICNGQGSVGYANYMDVDFIGTTDIVAGYNERLNRNIGLFIATVLCQERPKYSFGRKWKTRLRDTIIRLPKTSNGSPNWSFMEEYICSLNSEPISTINNSDNSHKILISGWKEFSLNEVFSKMEPGKVSQANQLEEGADIPYLGAKKDHNGIMFWCESTPELTSKGNCVILICDGQGSVGLANYMESDFLGTVNLMLCYNDKHLNKYTGIFLATVLSKERPKYSFGRKWKTHLEETTILLPQTDDGCPDWNYMENYIKTMPYGDRI